MHQILLIINVHIELLRHISWVPQLGIPHRIALQIVRLHQNPPIVE